jgi:hypothetical protein
MTATQIEEVEQVYTNLLGSVIVARNFVYVDWSKVDNDLEHTFKYLASIRLHKCQLWATAQIPLASGPVQASSIIPELPTIKGKITDIDPLDAKGQPASWETAISFAFQLIADGSVTIPKTALTALVATTHNPVLIAATALSMLTLPKNITFDFGHTTLHVPITRDKDGKIQKIGEAVRPSA